MYFVSFLSSHFDVSFEDKIQIDCFYVSSSCFQCINLGACILAHKSGDVDTDVLIITARQHSLLCRALYISYSKSVRPSVRLSVRPSVRHTLALSQNNSSYDHGVFTGG